MWGSVSFWREEWLAMYFATSTGRNNLLDRLAVLNLVPTRLSQPRSILGILGVQVFIAYCTLSKSWVCTPRMVVSSQCFISGGRAEGISSPSNQ